MCICGFIRTAAAMKHRAGVVVAVILLGMINVIVYMFKIQFLLFC